MRFLPLLKGGSSPKFAAEAFLDAVYTRSEEGSDLFYELAANFIMDCFDAIGLKLIITAEDVENRFENFQWPVKLLEIYVFKYNKIKFSPVDQFFYEIGIITLLKQREWLNIHKEELTAEYMEDHQTPLDVLMQVVAAWRLISEELLKPESVNCLPKYFEEPLARIDFQLLRGVNELRRSYRKEMPILDRSCHNLLCTAQLGIRYPETHSEIVRGLLLMFNNDFHLFYEYSNSSIDFYYTIFTTECPKKSYRLVYESFIELLQRYGVNHRNVDSENTNAEAQQRSLMITNFMVASKMLDAYYYTIVKKENKTVALAALDFLDVLQSKLVSLDCFSEVFMEGILHLVLSIDRNIGKKAAKTYITMMQCRSDAESTIKHIIGFYYTQMNTPEWISRYVERLWKYFRPMMNINYYAETLQQRATEAEPARKMTAHFAVAIFNLMLKKYGIGGEPVVSFLRKLMDILKQLKCQTTQGILLDAFDTIKKTYLETVIDDLKESFINLEEYAQHIFVTLENLQYPLLNKWFLLWEALAQYSGNLHRIDESALAIIAKYNEFSSSMEEFLRKPNRNKVRQYRNLLQRLCLVIQSNHFMCEYESQVLKDIRIGLMNFEPAGNGVFYDYAFKFKDFIDVYALEIYTISLIKLYNERIESMNRIDYEWLKSKTQEFENHLRSWIQNTDNIISQPLVRIKTGDSKEFKDYEEDSRLHPLRTLSYQRIMVQRFVNFHKCIGVRMNFQYIWHFCLYYGLPQADNFKNELYELMQILARYYFPIYKEIIPIIVFNLYSFQPALNKLTILNSIKAHKSFIDSLRITDRGLLNLHIVFSVIERCDMFLKASNIKSHCDRLAPLQHLHKFVENLNLNENGGQLIREICDHTNNLRRNLLNSVELKTIVEFLKHFRA